MNDEKAESKAGNGTADVKGPPLSDGADSDTHHAPSGTETASAKNQSPPKPLWRTPIFWQTVFSGCLVLNAVVTYYLLSKQYQLARQQLVGTQAATVALHLSIYPNNALTVIFDHRGIVAAREVRFVFRAVRKSIPSLEDIETAINDTAYEPILSPEELNSPKEYSLPGFTPSVLEAIRRTEQTIMVTGEFSYQNGFGDIQTEEVCVYWLTGIPNRPEHEGGANSFYPCGDFSIRMKNVLKARQEMQAIQEDNPATRF